MASKVYNVGSTFVVTLTVTDDGGLKGTDSATITVGQANYDGTYSMIANPSMQSCMGLPATFVATTLTFTSVGTMLTATTPDPENPNGAPISMSGTLTGPSFTVSGNWTDSQGGTHDFTLVGMFSGMRYMATLNESITFQGLALCTLNWNVSGDKVN